MEFVICVANFIYDMYVCGRASNSGCSGGIIVDTDVLAADVDGKLNLCKQSKHMCSAHK